MTELDDLLKKPILYDVLATFIYFCTSETSRMLVNKVIMMQLFVDKWGVDCENAPAELKEILEDVHFKPGPMAFWSERIGGCFNMISLGGTIAWIANTDYYWVEKSRIEPFMARLSPETISHIEELAREYCLRTAR